MRQLDPRILEVAETVYAEQICSRPVIRDDDGDYYSEFVIDGFKARLRERPIYDLPHACDQPLRCAAASLLSESNGGRRLWEGYWNTQPVKFLHPNCRHIGSGPTTSGRDIAEVIGELQGYEVVGGRTEDILNDIAREYQLFVHLDRPDVEASGIFPLVTTSTTSYWYKEDLQQYCKVLLNEIETNGRALAAKFIQSGLKVASPDRICILCGRPRWGGDLAHFQPGTNHLFLHHPPRRVIEDGPAFTYGVHQGKCLTELTEALHTYQRTARQAMAQLEHLGVSDGKGKGKTKHHRSR